MSPYLKGISLYSLKLISKNFISGLCEGLDSVADYKDQFKFQKKADLKKGDRYLYDVFQASANKTASYRSGFLKKIKIKAQIHPKIFQQL